ncbi:endo-1,4-beta-xylanase [Paenibacillus sp. FSL R7-0345]|uniref:endo-1,4-beta-xylanase n=1 Tax=Paenibacillus sp. FSL R7-0345 TaxID=2954535 RepID=UPI00315A930D
MPRPMLRENLKLFSQLGPDIQITELDVDTGISPSSPLLFEFYKKYKDTISSVTIWGVQDEKSPHLTKAQAAVIVNQVYSVSVNL